MKTKQTNKKYEECGAENWEKMEKNKANGIFLAGKLEAKKHHFLKIIGQEKTRIFGKPFRGAGH